MHHEKYCTTDFCISEEYFKQLLPEPELPISIHTEAEITEKGNTIHAPIMTDYSVFFRVLCE